MQESKVWALQPTGAARSTLCDVSRGDRTSAVEKDRNISKILGRFLAPDMHAFCHTKPRHRSEWKQNFSPFPFPLPEYQI